MYLIGFTVSLKLTSAWNGLLAAFPHGIYPTSVASYLVPGLVTVVLVCFIASQ